MQVTVYADEAFFLNGAVDYLLLMCAAKLGGGLPGSLNYAVKQMLFLLYFFASHL